MSSLVRRISSIVPIVATASLAGKEGYAYKLDGSNQAVLCSAVTDVPQGIIAAVSDDGLEISAAPFAGAQGGTIGVKLGTAVTDLTKALSVKADSTFEPDDGAGARVLCAMPLETGAADEIIECILFQPICVTANGAINTLIFPIQYAAMTTAAADLLTNYTPGYAFELLSFDCATTTLGTGSGATQTLNLEIGTTDVTGGVLTLALADTTPLGKVKAATAITALNTGTSTDTLSVEVAASGTVFTAGAGNLIIKLRNRDTYRSLAGAMA